MDTTFNPEYWPENFYPWEMSYILSNANPDFDDLVFGYVLYCAYKQCWSLEYIDGEQKVIPNSKTIDVPDYLGDSLNVLILRHSDELPILMKKFKREYVGVKSEILHKLTVI